MFFLKIINKNNKFKIPKWNGRIFFFSFSKQFDQNIKN